MRTWIKNGLIYDGSGEKPYRGNVIVEGDQIAEISLREDVAADVTVDAKGMAVTPGFIDIHRHCDLEAVQNPEFGVLELRQGITTVFGGNCGLGAVPLSGEFRTDILDYLEPCLGKGGARAVWGSFGEYLNILDGAGLRLHMGSFLGLGTVLASVKGYAKMPVTGEQMDRARECLREGLEAGAAGISLGLMYQPECYASHEELIKILQAASPYGRLLTCHIRGEGDHLAESVEEVIRLGKETGLPVNISHFKVTGKKNWGTGMLRAIDVIERERAGGLEVTVDVYPYCAGATTAVSLLPPSVIKDSVAGTLQELSSKKGMERARDELYKNHEGWDNMVLSIGWDRIVISSVTLEENRWFCGKSVQEAADLCGCEEPCYVLFELMKQEQGKVGVILQSMAQEDVDRAVRLDYAAVISDGLYGAGDHPHPRLYGSFPKMIREYVTERKILTMEEAVKKMTMLPAKRLGLKDRGMLRPGLGADINLFAAGEVADRAVYGDSKQFGSGFAMVMVDGNVAVWKDEIQRKLPPVKAVRL